MNSRTSGKNATGLERGFKTWAENTSLNVRSRLGLRTTDPLPYRLLADHLGVRLWEPGEVPGLPHESVRYLLSTGADEWSAVSVRVGPVDVIVTNPTHSPARQSSDVMHELAHILRGHQPAQAYVSTETAVSIRTFNAFQEAEADWLAGCLLLPRPVLLQCAARGTSEFEARKLYSVSGKLFRYRMNVTGVKVQIRRRGRRV